MFRLLTTLFLLSPLLARELPVRRFTVADGLGDNRVKRILVDSRGLLWMCTSAGISRFDGTRFQNFGTTEGLPYPSINDLLETTSGDFWLASNGGGLIRFSLTAGRPHQAFSLGGGPTAERINRLYQAPDKTIWLGTDGGLFRMNPGSGTPTFTRVNLHAPGHAEETTQVWVFGSTPDGSLWVGSRFGLFRMLPGGGLVHYPVRESTETDSVHALLYTADGLLWVGHQSGIAVLKPLPATAYPKGLDGDRPFEDRSLVSAAAASHASILDSRIALPVQAGKAVYLEAAAVSRTLPIADIVEADGGAIRIVVSGGVFEFNRGRLTRLEDARFDNPILAATTDRDGNLWIGTQGIGALRLQRRGFVTYRGADGIADAISSVFEDRRGDLIAISQDWRVSRLDGERFHSVQAHMPAAVLRVGYRGDQQTIQDREGDWWFATSAGVVRYTNIHQVDDLATAIPKLYTAGDGVAQNSIHRLFEDSRGDIWMAGLIPSRDVLTRWERSTGRFYRYSDADGLTPFNAARGFFEDRRGNLWIGFRDGGMARYRNGRFQMLSAADGLAPGAVLHGILDHAGRLWLAIDRAGVFRIDDLEAKPMHPVCVVTPQQLRGAYIGYLVEYGDNQIFALSSQGVIRIDDTQSNPHIAALYTDSDGLANSEPLSAFADRHDRLWFGTTQGLSYYQREPGAAPAPKIRIGGIRVAGIDRPISPAGEQMVELPDILPGTNGLEIDFFGVSFASGGPLQFEHRLVGGDGRWLPPGLLRSVLFSSLAPGSYRFEVRAVSPVGMRSREVATAVFRVLPPIWRRWWFLLMASLAVVAGLTAFERYRAARVREVRVALSESRRLAEELGEANRTLSLEAAVTRILAESETPSEAAPRIIEEVCNATGWGTGAIWECDRESPVMHCLAGEPDLARSLDLAGRVQIAGEALWVEHLPEAQRGSGFAFPVLIGREVIAVATFFSDSVRPPDAAQIRALSALGSHIGQVVEAVRSRRAREERLAELERVRHGIAADLHDEIGSSLTEIAILSEVARSGGSNGAAALGDPLSTIGTLSRELVESMSDIVWAVNPAKDRLSDLSQRMRRFAISTLTAFNIAFHLELPPPERELKLGANMRRELFLIFKEGLNNIVKHSGCSEATIRLTVLPKALHLRIHDNGRGFNPAAPSDGHGLGNLRRRARALNGALVIDTAAGSGVTLRLEVPLP